MASNLLQSGSDLAGLPDELLLLILSHLDVPDLLSFSRVSTRFRAYALDPILHVYRRRYSASTLSTRLSNRLPLSAIRPPESAIYLSRTHLVAKRLHWSLVSLRLNRSLSRRPTVLTLVGANVIPRDCCRRDRTSGEFTIARIGQCSFMERKRHLEREQLKAGLRVWMERKAREIRKRKKDYIGVGALVWRFSRKTKGLGIARPQPLAHDRLQGVPEKGHVLNMRKFWEGVTA